MYNRIGLQTPRGSGTSGYIQTNLSYQKPVHSKLEFLKQMRKLKENTLAVNFQANPEIINHKKKREIYALLEDTRQELLKSGRDTAEVEEILKDAEARMLEKFEKGELEISIDKQKMMDSHQLAELKRAQEAKIKEALKIGNDYKFGSAFDFELQEKLRLEKIYKRELEKLEQMQREDDEAELQTGEAQAEPEIQIPFNQEQPVIPKPTIDPIEEKPVKAVPVEDSSAAEVKEKKHHREKHRKKRHHDSSNDRSSSSDHRRKHKKRKHDKISKRSKHHDRHSKRKYSSSDNSSDDSEPRKEKRPSRFN